MDIKTDFKVKFHDLERFLSPKEFSTLYENVPLAKKHILLVAPYRLFRLWCIQNEIKANDTSLYYAPREELLRGIHSKHLTEIARINWHHGVDYKLLEALEYYHKEIPTVDYFV